MLGFKQIEKSAVPNTLTEGDHTCTHGIKFFAEFSADFQQVGGSDQNYLFSGMREIPISRRFHTNCYSFRGGDIDGGERRSRGAGNTPELIK